MRCYVVAKNIFYSAAVCPFCHRAAIAFTEVGLPYEKVEIDLLDKPAWYENLLNDYNYFFSLKRHFFKV